MTEFQLPTDLFYSLNNIIRYQNTILLKEICRDYKWDYNSLKKKYIKDKVVKNKMVESENENTKKSAKTKAIKKKIKTKEQKEEEKPIILGKRKIKVKKVKKKKVKEDEIECRIIKYDKKTYYISNDNCAYDIDGDFCGILEDNEKINFDAEPAI